MLALLRFLTTRDLAPESALPHSASDRLSPRWLAFVIAGALGVVAALLAGLAALSFVPAESLRYGGSNGVAAEIACPIGHVVVGARVYEDAQMVAGIALVCGAYGRAEPGALVETPLLGSARGNLAVISCPAELAAVGIWGAAGQLLDQFSLACARAERPRSPVHYLSGAGGQGGHGFHVRCPGRLRGLQGAAATYVERVAMICEDGDV